MKKTISILLALVLLLSLSVTAFASGDTEPTTPPTSKQASNNTITVNNAKAGETYKAFKMLELFVNDTSNPTAYAYTVAPGWEEFFADNNSSVWGTVLVKDSTGYFQAKEGISSETAWNATSALSKFAEAAAQYAAKKDLPAVVSVSCETGKTTVVLNTTESGYYLVTSTLGTRAMIDTTPGNVVINEKNSVDSIEKQVQEDSNSSWGASNDAQIGDTVNFKTKVTVVPRSVNVVIHDNMDTGLTFSGNSSIRLYTDEDCNEELSRDLYTIKSSPDAGDTFTIEIKDAFAANTTTDANIYIPYSAVLNQNVVSTSDSAPAIVNQTNTASVTYGDSQSVEVTTTTTTHSFKVFKHAKDSTDNLAGAIFQLKKAGGGVNLVKINDTNYRVANATETGTVSSHVADNNEVNPIAAGSIVSDFVTVASGDIVIWGVDSDSDYTINELQAPKGYNKLTGDVNVTVGADNNTRIDVENQTGAELPSTGGIGTTLFYVIGGLLVVGAVVVLVSKKRMEQ